MELPGSVCTTQGKNLGWKFTSVWWKGKVWSGLFITYPSGFQVEIYVFYQFRKFHGFVLYTFRSCSTHITFMFFFLFLTTPYICRRIIANSSRFFSSWHNGLGDCPDSWWFGVPHYCVCFVMIFFQRERERCKYHPLMIMGISICIISRK